MRIGYGWRGVVGGALALACLGGAAREARATTVLLLHGDGSGSTFVDSSPSNHAITAQGTATQSTAQSVLGPSSAFFNNPNPSANLGSGTDYLSTPVSPDFSFGTSDFTIETYIRPVGNQQYGSLVSSMAETEQTSAWNFGYSNATNVVTFWGAVFGANGDLTGSGYLSATVAPDVWHHLAVERSGTSTMLYVDGVLTRTLTVAANANFAAGGQGVAIGRRYTNAGATYGYFNGYMDEVKVTNGQALYTANFTPSAFAPEPHTTLLLALAAIGVLRRRAAAHRI